VIAMINDSPLEIYEFLVDLEGFLRIILQLKSGFKTERHHSKNGAFLF